MTRARIARELRDAAAVAGIVVIVFGVYTGAIFLAWALGGMR